MTGAGSFDIVTVGGASTLYVDSDRINDCVEYYLENGIDRLGINPTRGYRLGDIEFVRRYPHIKAVLIVGGKVPFEMSPIESIQGLRSLIVSFPAPDLQLSGLSALEEFRGYWNRKLGLERCAALRILNVSGYDSKASDLTAFPVPPRLEEFGIVQAKGLTSLRGVSRIAGIRLLELAHLAKLESLDGVESLAHLEILDCQRCRRVTKHEQVRTISSLRVLRFNDCGEIASLKFLDDLPQLEEFRFVNTNVVDGDLTPLLRLKRVGFLAKRHYSHTPEELDVVLRRKGGSAIARVE